MTQDWTIPEEELTEIADEFGVEDTWSLRDEIETAAAIYSTDFGDFDAAMCSLETLNDARDNIREALSALRNPGVRARTMRFGSGFPQKGERDRPFMDQIDDASAAVRATRETLDKADKALRRALLVVGRAARQRLPPGAKRDDARFRAARWLYWAWCQLPPVTDRHASRKRLLPAVKKRSPKIYGASNPSHAVRFVAACMKPFCPGVTHKGLVGLAFDKTHSSDALRDAILIRGNPEWAPKIKELPRAKIQRSRSKDRL